MDGQTRRGPSRPTNAARVLVAGVAGFALAALGPAPLPAAPAAQAGADGRNGSSQVRADTLETVRRAVVTDPTAMAVPFGPGENLRYKVKLGPVEVGEGHMRVEGIDSIRGHATYHVSMGLRASAFFGTMKVDDSFESWLDTRMLVSRRFIRRIDEPYYESLRAFDIFPEEQRWERTDGNDDKKGKTPSALPLDEIALLYYVRTLPLKVGETYTLNRYFKEEDNPVIVRVLRRETVKVPAGTFETVVVQPVIKTSGLFSEGGEAEVYFTDDADRHMVYMRSKVPVVGSITLHLESVERGVPLNPKAR